jgi:trimeric autotransporter adhesin
MNTGHRSKAGLNAVRFALLTGVTGVALSLGISSVEAQTVNVDGVNPNALLNTNGGKLSTGATAATGLTFDNGAAATFNGGTTSTKVDSTGLNTSGTVTVKSGANSQVLDSQTLTTTSGTDTSKLTASQLSVTNGSRTSTLTSTSLTVDTATFGTAGNTAIDGPGNLTVGTAGTHANLTVTGITTTNGISNTGDIGTATLTATGQIQGGTLTDGTAKLTGGNLSFVNNIAGTGNITGFQNGTFSDTVGASTLSAGSGGLTSAGLITGQNGLKITAGGANITGNSSITGDLGVTGTATFNGTGANTGTNTRINGALVGLNGSLGSITLNANVDPVLQVTNGTSTTTITNGSINSTVAGQGSTNINGGVVNVFGTFGGNVTSLPGNQAVTVNGGSVLNNGVIVNDGFHAFGGSTLNGGATVNGPTQLNGSLAVAPGNNISMGGNIVHDVATPIVGTDAANKAYVDTTVGKTRNQAFEGTAVALAISQPILLPGQTFAMRGGWGDFEGQNAAGFSAAGVIGRDWLGYGSTVTVDAGVGVGTSFSGVGGKAGVTIGFGGVPPIK